MASSRKSRLPEISEKWKKLMILIGCTLLTMPAALQVYYGNILPYIASYYLAHASTIKFMVDPLWVMSAYRMAQPAGMMIAGRMERKLSVPNCLAIGVFIVCFSVFISAFSIIEPAGFIVTFGAIQGIGAGIVAALSYKYAAEWMPGNRGLAMGVLSAGPGIYPLFNMLLAYYLINPENKVAHYEVNNIFYFTDPDLISRVPNFFWQLSLCIGSLAFIGLVMIRVKKGKESETECSETRRIISSTSDSGYEYSSLEYGIAEEAGKKDINCSKDESGKETPNGDLSSRDKQAVDINNAGNECDTSNTELKDVIVEVEKQPERSPGQMLRSFTFWRIWFLFVCMGHVLFINSNLFKQFGQTRINNDHLLVITGILGSVAMTLFRPFSGLLADKFGLKLMLLILCALSNIAMALMPITLYTYWPLYIPVVMLEFLSISSVFVLYKLVPLAYFGRQNYSSNMGLLATSQVLIYFLEPFYMETFIKNAGWAYVFLTGTISSTIGVFLCLSLPWIRLNFK